jgi:hypothetical protein
MIETVNIEYTRKLAQITFSQYLDLLGQEEHECKVSHYKSNFKKPDYQYNLMIGYCKYLIKNNFKKDVSYVVKNKDYGRQFAEGGSLQLMNKKLRGVLSKDVYTDYDMVNCQFSILLDICKQSNITCEYLEDYCNKRESQLKDIQSYFDISRSQAKDLVISMLFNDRIYKKIYKRKNDLDFLVNLNRELNNIQKKFIKKYPQLYKSIISKGKKDNVGGSLMSNVLAQKENEILEYVIQKFPANVKIFDGFLSTQKHSIDEINSYCKKKYNVTWTIKELDLSIEEDLQALNIDNNSVSYVGSDERDIAEYLMQTKFNNRIYNCYNEMYMKTEYKWTNHKEEIKRQIAKDILKCDLYLRKDDKFVCISGTCKGVEDLRKLVLVLIPINDDLINDMWENTKQKLYFKNGYYDFKEDKFIENDERYTTMYINRDYNPIRNESLREEIMNRIFLPIFNKNENMLGSFLYETAHSLAGEVDRKSWYCLEGFRNCGKGMITDLLIKTFHKYIATTNADNLFPKDTGGDSAKALSFLVDIEFARLITTQEINLNPDKQTFIDGNKIKKFTSGGDWIEARKNYQDEKRFRLQGSLMLCCNDFPVRKPADCNETLVHYSFESKFVDKNESKDIEGIAYYEKDNTLKSSFLTREDVQNEFVNILIDAYKKPYDKPVIINDDDEEDDYKKFIGLFEFTKNAYHRVSNAEIKKLLKKYKIDFTINKAGKLLKGYKCQRYSDGKGRGFQGLVIKQDVESYEDTGLDD